MTVTLALLRHGGTPWSADKRVQGRTDIALSPAAAAALAKLRLPPECDGMRVFTSPLRRCVQTATELGLAAAVETRLQEMAWGDWEGRRLVDLRRELGHAMAQNEARGWDFMPPGGESPRLVWQRLQPCLAAWAEHGQPTLAVTHRGVMRVIFAKATGWDMLGKPPVRLDWSALQLFTLDAHGVPAVLWLNLPLCSRTRPDGALSGASR